MSQNGDQNKREEGGEREREREREAEIIFFKMKLFYI